MDSQDQYPPMTVTLQCDADGQRLGELPLTTTSVVAMLFELRREHAGTFHPGQPVSTVPMTVVVRCDPCGHIVGKLPVTISSLATKLFELRGEHLCGQPSS